MESLCGRLLVATPAIERGPFWRAVVYMLDHDAAGALGVIVNRPLESDVDDVLPEWAGLVSAPECLFDGGPVAMDSALAVGVLGSERPPVGWRRTAGRIGLVDLGGPIPVVGDFLMLRIFAGYAGWDPGQLEDELASGSWVVVDAQDADLSSPTPDALWSEVFRRQDGELRFWATFPEDPSSN